MIGAVVLAQPALVPLASVHVTTAPSRLKKKSAPALAMDLAALALVLQVNVPALVALLKPRKILPINPPHAVAKV